MLIRGDARYLPLVDGCVDSVVTSPPYFGLRDYGHAGQIGLELSISDYVSVLVEVFAGVRRVLKDSGTVWLNIGDSYAGSWGAQGRPQGDGEMSGRSVASARQIASHLRFNGLTGNRGAEIGLKSKDLMMIPARVALALQADGWYLRSDIIWAKPNPMPESVTDRPTKAHEYLFLLSKSERYHYDADAIAEPVSAAMLQEVEQGYEGLGLKDYEADGVPNPSTVKARIIANARRKNEQSGDRRKVGFNDRWDTAERAERGYTASAYGDRPQSAQRGPSSNFGEFVTRNRRTVWTIPTMPYAGAHFATMPEALVQPCILAGCPLGGLVLDPFVGSGTVVSVAERLGRRGVGVDLSYQDLAKKRTAQRGIRFTA